MTKIIYKPHCGRCGFPIDTSEEEIAYQDVYDECFSEMKLNKKVFTDIYPCKCSHCGEFFECIEMIQPKKMPDKHI